MDDKITHKSWAVIQDFLINHSHKNKINEICGFIGYDTDTKEFVATIEKNEAIDTKSFFSICPVKYLKFKKQYSLVAVFHSHIIGDENPSEFDIKMAESACLSFVIYSLNSENFYIYEPKFPDYDVKIMERIKVKIK